MALASSFQVRYVTTICSETPWAGELGISHPSYIPHISLIYPSYIPHISLIYPSYIPHLSLIYPSYIPHISLIYPSYIPHIVYSNLDRFLTIRKKICKNKSRTLCLGAGPGSELIGVAAVVKVFPIIGSLDPH